jgi:hypothetical protein
MNKLVLVAASILSIGFFGCAAETSTTEAESTTEALHHRAPVVGELEHCGGNFANAPVCDTGLHCQLNVSRPNTGGICVRKGYGDSCGGNTATPATCAAGLECILNVSRPDTGGTCGYASYGQSCGGNTAAAVVCGVGLACSHIAADGTFINPDFPGVCLEAAGQPCGGNTTDPHACAGGLTCVGGATFGDVGGTCQ